MSSYNELIALINGCINRNGVQAITGRVLNGVLRAMVNQLGAGYAMGGVAHPADDPGTPEAPVCYYASEVGTYTHFGNIQIVPGELALLCFDLTDGWFKETMYEGFESVQATIDGNVGTPAVNVTYVNGVLSFDFSNMKGNTGAAAGFGNVTAAVDGTSGTPGVSVQTDGPDTAKNIAFQFTGLKGETGVTSVIATVDNTSGTPQCAVSLNGQQLTLAFTGLKGAQGDTGSSVAYPFTIVNNLTTNDPTQALSAAMGVQLESEVSQLEAKLYVKSKKNLLSFLNRVDASPTGAWPITKYDITEGVWYRGYSYSGYFYSAAPANQVQINTVTPTSLSFTQPIASYGLGLLVRVKGNTTYTLSLQTGGNPNSAARRIVEIDSSGNAIKNYGIGSFPSTFTTDANCVAIILCIYKASANESITISNWQLEEGSLATDFEPADVFITTDEQQCERESNKVSKISTGDSVKYPSTKAVVDYVHDETRETIDTTNYTGGTALDKTIFDVKNGNVVIVNTSASFPSGLKFTVVANGETVQTKNYYSAVSNDRLNITEDGTLKMSASSANTNNATIIVSLLNYGAIVERLVELVGNFAPDVASFELTNPAVKEFIDTVTYDNSDYTYTEVGDYNAKKQYRTDQPLPVTIRWIPEEVIDTYILVSENTPVVPVTWTSVQPPKSDFWYRVPSGVFSYDIYNLIPGKTYYYGVYGVVASGVKILKEGSFTTTGSVRMLNVDYAQNIRDLGGWAADGGMVKYDRIFRGDALDEPERLNHLSQAGVLEMSVRIVIREDIDLRGESSYRINGAGEIVAGSPIGEFAEYFPAGIQPYAAGIQNSGTTIASIFEKINSALTENRPRKIYFHCSGGCDRTGTLAFLILGLLGVSESDLSKEYELSTFANALGYPLGLYRTRNSTVYPFSGMVDAIKQYTGATLADKIETYLLGVGVAQTTIDSLRSELIETS